MIQTREPQIYVHMIQIGFDNWKYLGIKRNMGPLKQQHDVELRFRSAYLFVFSVWKGRKQK